MALGSHDVRLKCIDSKITHQNRIIGKLAAAFSQCCPIRIPKAHLTFSTNYKFVELSATTKS